MTTQSQPLTLKLSNGQEVSIAEAKSVLQHTKNGRQRSCAIVQGPEGAAVYNAEGDVQINGAPSSAHWLQQGDTLEFGDGVSASVEKLGVMEQAIQELNEDYPISSAQTPLSPEQVAPASPTSPAPATTDYDQDSFKPATAAAAFIPEPQQAEAPAEPAAPATTFDLSEVAAEAAIPVAVSSALAAAGILKTTDPAEETEAVVTPNELVGFTLPTPTPTPTAVEPAADLPTTGFAAELMARIQAEENNVQAYENEAVGTQSSETSHSPLATDGPSFSSPENDQEAISSLIPELPSVPAPAQNNQPEVEPESLETQSPALVETTTAESTERQAQSSSVSALLERMKDEGQWGGLSEEAVEEAATPATVETSETPVLNEADEDVQSYMSQLLSRMRDPNEENPRPAAPAVASPQSAEPEVAPEIVEAPKPVGLLKPEEYIPKTKARRLDSLQDMRALANTQTRTAIDRSQARRLQASVGIFNVMIGVAGGVAAAIALMLGFVGYVSFLVAGIAVVMIAMLCVGGYFGKAFFYKLLESQKDTGSAAPTKRGLVVN